ncbi:MAG: zinc-ribbon domain-containing protein [Clostridiales bacterium]|nr:zinc-ribbon domain-containing protein [Clostridiales bacterium]
MGFFKNIVTSQLIDVIEWKDDTQNTMVHRYDMNGKEIMMGAQLTVRESQVAVFVNEGQLADVYQPGRYELTTQNMPIMTALKSWKFGFNSPFKADLYFVNTKQFLDRKWGTSNPVMMRDSEFGMIRIRAFGIFAFRVTNPETFLKEVFGTNSMFTVEDVEGQIKRTVVSGLSDAIAESKIPALDLAANYEELSQYALKALNPKVEALGLSLTSFIIENISLPEEVEKSIDKRTSMGVVGDLNKYSQYQAAEAMREAANNPNGGLAGMGVGMGAGAAMGQMFTQSMNAGAQPQQTAAPAQAATTPCTACGKQIPVNSRFCPECGTAQAVAGKCTNCGAVLQPGAKFCPACGQKV